MPVEISELPNGTVPVDSDIIPAVQGAPLTTYKISFSQIKDWIETFVMSSPWRDGTGTSSTQGGTATAVGDYTIAFGNAVAATGNYSFAYGRNLTTNFNGTFLIGDSTTSHSAPTANNQFVATYGNGYFLNITPSLKGVEIDSSGNLKIYNNAALMNAAGTFSINLKAPSGITSNATFELPSADASNGNVMITNGAGALSLSSYVTLQGVTLAANATIANALTYNGTNGLFFGTDQLLNRNGSVTANNIAVWNNNGSIKDGGTLGNASTKAVSNNSFPSVASVQTTPSITATHLPVFIDNAGSIGMSPTTTSTITLDSYLTATRLTTTRLTFTTGSTAAGSISYNGTLLYFGTDAIVRQTGSMSAGNVCVWSNNGLISNGGVLPPKTINLVTLTSLSSTAYTPSANTRILVIEGVGAGAGGGSAFSSVVGVSSGSGGGAGSYFRLIINNPAASYNYICGTGGASGANGTSTLFRDSSGVTILGSGIGGITGVSQDTATPPQAVLQGGLGGSTSMVGNITVPGDQGESGFAFFGLTGIGATIVGGGGASSPFGRGGVLRTLTSTNTVGNGNNATGYGAGGGGGAVYNRSPVQNGTGGTGAQGVIYVYEYI